MAAQYTAYDLIDMIDTNESDDDADGEFVDSDSDDDPDYEVPVPVRRTSEVCDYLPFTQNFLVTISKMFQTKN